MLTRIPIWMTLESPILGNTYVFWLVHVSLFGEDDHKPLDVLTPYLFCCILDAHVISWGI